VNTLCYFFICLISLVSVFSLAGDNCRSIVKDKVVAQFNDDFPGRIIGGVSIRKINTGNYKAVVDETMGFTSYNVGMNRKGSICEVNVPKYVSFLKDPVGTCFIAGAGCHTSHQSSCELFSKADNFQGIFWDFSQNCVN